MRRELWPDEGDPPGHAGEIENYFAGRETLVKEVLLAFDTAGCAVGFAELSIRPYAEECVTDRVAYLEGWYVDSAHRRRGVGRALIEAAERWGVQQGCREFASDALIDNIVSAKAHTALGFTETSQIRCFRKDLVR